MLQEGSEQHDTENRCDLLWKQIASKRCGTCWVWIRRLVFFLNMLQRRQKEFLVQKIHCGRYFIIRRAHMKQGILVLTAALLLIPMSGCSSGTAAVSSTINVNDTLTAPGELPVTTWTYDGITEAYPDAVFVNAEGKVLPAGNESPYSLTPQECYLGPLRIAPDFKNAYSVDQLSGNGIYISGAKLSWWKSLQLNSSEALPVADVQPEEPILIPADSTISIYFFPVVYLDPDSSQYAVLKDTGGSAKGIWMVQ